MLREKVLRSWKNYKEKVKGVIDEFNDEILNYRVCFIIATNDNPKPRWHKKERMLIDEIPHTVVSSHDVITGLDKNIKPDLTYCYDGRTFQGYKTIVLLSGPEIEEVD